MTLRRAYSLFTVEAIDEDSRTLEGIATTPTPDRLGDIVEPEGAQFSRGVREELDDVVFALVRGRRDLAIFVRDLVRGVATAGGRVVSERAEALE